MRIDRNENFRNCFRMSKKISDINEKGEESETKRTEESSGVVENGFSNEIRGL